MIQDLQKHALDSLFGQTVHLNRHSRRKRGLCSPLASYFSQSRQKLADDGAKHPDLRLPRQSDHLVRAYQPKNRPEDDSAINQNASSPSLRDTAMTEFEDEQLQMHAEHSLGPPDAAQGSADHDGATVDLFLNRKQFSNYNKQNNLKGVPCPGRLGWVKIDWVKHSRPGFVI